MAIAYLPVYSRLLQSKVKTESYWAWIGLGLAPLLSLFSSKGVLATIYSLRAAVLISILLGMMFWIDYIKPKRFNLPETG